MSRHVRRTPLLLLPALALFFVVQACDSGTGTEPAPETGAVEGTVVADGDGVAGATISIQGHGSTTTDGSGGYSFSSIPAGSHSVGISPPGGFELGPGQSASQTVQVSAGQTARADWILVPGDPGDNGDNGDNGTGEVVEVNLTTGNRFDPETITITPGTTVRWINDANILHTVTPDDPDQPGVWTAASSNSAGTMLEHTFEVSGETYDYHCEPHLAEGMVGTVVVQ